MVPRMPVETFKLPTREAVAQAGEQFCLDPETKMVEAALTDIFARYPSNKDEAQVLLKVVMLNQLYSTQLPTRAADRPNVFDVAKCIPGLGLDHAFRDASLDIVDRLSTVLIPGKRPIGRFSFATKYASWHRQDVYPIWDQNVQRYFSCLRKLHRDDWYRIAQGFILSGNWAYPQFHGLMVRFRSHFGLDDVSFKDLDKVLWICGADSTKAEDP
jgi:hypothetical protein